MGWRTEGYDIGMASGRRLGEIIYEREEYSTRPSKRDEGIQKKNRIGNMLEEMLDLII